MNGKICIVTGANAGIGKATTLRLARQGATVVMVCRDRDRGEEARNAIAAASGNSNLEVMVADLSSQNAIRSLTGAFRARHPRLHVLVNNAGIAPLRRSITVDGMERVFAVNYLAPFLLTHLLIGELRAGAPARVVNVAGEFHRKATIRFDDLMSEKDYSGFHANNQAKLALIIFTYEMARRMEHSGVTVNCLHPGATTTDGPLGDPDLRGFRRILFRMVRLLFQNPDRAAESIEQLASAPTFGSVTGAYFIKSKRALSSPETYDRGIATKLWKESTRLTGIHEPA